MDNKIFAVVFVFCVWVIYSISPVNYVTDSRWSIPTGLSLIREHNADLAEFPEILEYHDSLDIQLIDGLPYSPFPVWTYMLSTPFIFVFDKVGIPLIKSIPRVENIVNNGIYRIYGKAYPIETVYLSFQLESVIASFYCSITALIVYFIAMQYLKRKPSILLALLFVFGTSSWSTASRALWMHGPSMMFLSAAALLLMKAPANRKLAAYSGIPLSAAFLIRPTNAVALVCITVYLFFEYREQLIKFILLSLPLAVMFIWYNISLYHSILPHYFTPTRLSAHANILEALAGNLISPARGLFVYSPFLLFAVPGMYLGIKRREGRALHTTLFSIIIAHWIAISLFPHWWGGFCYGPRYFTDMIPYIFIFLFISLKSLFTVKVRMPYLTIFVILSIVSIAINARGAIDYQVYDWNVTPVHIDFSPERLWDWSDPQFLR